MIQVNASPRGAADSLLHILSSSVLLRRKQRVSPGKAQP